LEVRNNPMKKLLLIAGVFFTFFALPAKAQQTQVTGCIVDPNNIPYAGGQILITISPAGGPAPSVNGQAIQGTFGPTPLDSNGCMPATALWPNAQISPSGTKWNFNVTNPGAAAPVGFGPVSVPAAGGGVNITISGATQDVGSTLSAVAPKLFNDSSGSPTPGTCIAPVTVGELLYSNGVSGCLGIPNSTGNTPTNGFTLSNGSDTNAQNQSEITLTSPGNPGVIDLNSEAGPTITVGNQDTIGSSTLTAKIVPGQVGLANLSTSLSAVLGDPNTASLSLIDNASGTSIVEDGTVPSTTWNDGAGDTIVNTITSGTPSSTWTDAAGNSTIVGSPNAAGITETDAAGDIIVAAPSSGLVVWQLTKANGDVGNAVNLTNTSTAGKTSGTAYAAFAQIADSGGSSAQMLAFEGEAELSGSNVAGDEAFGGLFAALNTGTGTATEVSGAEFQRTCGTATTCSGVHITGTNAITGVSAAVLIDRQGAGISAIATDNCTSSVSPAVCASAPAGLVVVAAAATTVVVDTTAAKSTSDIVITPNTSTNAGTRLGVTCNTSVPTTVPVVSAIVSGTSFTITTSAPVTNPQCFNYWITN
jgi:hypothetical protein